MRLATMRRIKGLEFSRVLLVSVQGGVVPLDIATLPDAVSWQDHEFQEQCLFYVS